MLQEALNTIIARVLPWLLILAVVYIVSAIFKTAFLPKIKGIIGEAELNALLRRKLDQNVYHLIPDIMLPTPSGTTQIDHIIVSRYGIFVIETKSYRGWIYGNEHDSRWTQVIFRRKERFQNPLRQNYKHTKTLSDLTGIPHEYFKPIIVFSAECTFKSDMPGNVVHPRGCIDYIQSHEAHIIKDDQVPDIVTVIREWAGTLTDKQKKAHIKNLRRRNASVPPDASAPSCPRCGESMTLRTNRKDGKQFWGCPNYPSCRGIRRIEKG